ncbi:putative tetratricopeptide-like helical domain superfamily [Helianthus annuus]|uniref:Putative tetratricopeptide-like helical domain-containing protein n=1 Tax=Helianthus annuus TaxID=4232 RepID=A0A251VCD1_HELAN|nr:pentatricopeptide repeat-containing protein At1g63330 [Helianthus annuus]XP_022029655.1 pentatricopeptide repeat-containing protein At1g63330 [Helianthus annuus]KAF5813544.1 putative tetratricopeptide-like helical domain superfamily [Helianthus annuus]KAJ0599779.1 putative tetratricopeptide-like helical domain superfamily [Helianthus annuus]KAJ0773163.1 putative tetratricopeptide-like helical domain superfamily [Helianthus annuus]KAJ0934728.1 putative tetratricopeptide-like helical domain s
MIIKSPKPLLSSTIHLISHVASLSCTNYIQSTDQNPLNSTQYEAKIQSLRNKLHPETLINILSSTSDLNSSLRLFKWASLQHHFQHTTDTYYHMIMKLGMASRVDEVEGFCNEMVKAGFSASEQALLRLIDGFVINHKLDEALRVFSVLSLNGYKPSVSLVNRVLGVLVEEKKGIKDVLFVYKEMAKADICPNTETLNWVMQALFDDDWVDSALDQYKRMEKKGCCANSRTYEIVVSGLIGKNRLDQALVVLSDVFESGCVFELEFFSCVLPLLFEMGEYDMGLRLFGKMKSLNVVPDLSVYEVLIWCFAKNQCTDDAMDLVNDMVSRDLKPSDCVFVDLVNGFCMLNKLRQAKQLLQDHQVTKAGSYNALLKGYCYCQAGSYADVMWLFQEMVEKNITNSLSWNILVSYLSENQRYDTVYKALTRMIVSGNPLDSTTYTALIIGRCKSNKVHDALDLFHHIREEQWIVDSSCYDTLIESLCQTNKIQDAVDVFHHGLFNKCIVRTSTFSMLIKGLCLNAKVNKVVDFLHLASHHGLSCSSEDYSIIMKSMYTLSKSNDLLTIVGRMVVEGCPLSSKTYNHIIKSMSDHQRSTECALYLNQMVNKGLLPDTEILSGSLSFLAQKLQLHTVLPAIHKLLSVSDHCVLNHAICNVIINGLWKEGYKQEARLVLDVILENGWVPDSTTHRLLISSGSSEADEKGGDTEDEISNILSEGFGEP